MKKFSGCKLEFSVLFVQVKHLGKNGCTTDPIDPHLRFATFAKSSPGKGKSHVPFVQTLE